MKNYYCRQDDNNDEDQIVVIYEKGKLLNLVNVNKGAACLYRSTRHINCYYPL